MKFVVQQVIAVLAMPGILLFLALMNWVLPGLLRLLLSGPASYVVLFSISATVFALAYRLKEHAARYARLTWIIPTFFWALVIIRDWSVLGLNAVRTYFGTAPAETENLGLLFTISAASAVVYSIGAATHQALLNRTRKPGKSGNATS